MDKSVMAKLSLAAEFPEVDEQAWQAAAVAALRGKPLQSLTKTTPDGIAIKPIYRADHSRPPLASPGGKATMAPWGIVQRADIPDIGAANQQMLEDLAGGATGIAVVLPGAVTAGAHGVPVRTRSDLERLFDGVELDLISLRLDSGREARNVVDPLYEVYASRGLDVSQCALNLGLDPISGFARTGFMPRRDKFVELMGERFRIALEHGLKGPVYVADNRVFQGAGASCAQDVAFALANLVELLRLLQDAGFPPERAARHLGLVVAAGPEQFPVIAKLRAIRLCWQRVCEAMGIETPWLQIDVETSLRMMTVHEPYVNMLRATTAAFGAGLGGANSVTVLPFSSALGLPDGFARRMTRNLQVIMQEESGLARVFDPAAGSGFIETLTCDLAQAGWEVFQKIESFGGLYESLLNGYVQAIIADAAASTRREVSVRQIKITGVSDFATLNQPNVHLDEHPLSEDWQSLDPLRQYDNDDLVKCDRLAQSRLSEEYERLRAAAAAYEQEKGHEPNCVFLVTLGTPADYSQRTSWVNNLLAAGGMSTQRDETAQTADAIVKAYSESDCVQACICSSDDIYGERAGDIAKALKAAGTRYVWLAGRPGANEAKLRSAGIDGFIYDGANVLGFLQSIHALSGIEKVELNHGEHTHG